MVETGGRLHARSLRSLKELVEGAVRDEVAKSACYKMAGLIVDLMKVSKKRMMQQHQLQAADPHGGGGDP